MKIKIEYVLVVVLFVSWILLMSFTDPSDFKWRVSITTVHLGGLAGIIWGVVKRKKDSK